jgi:hypothetical protein
MLASLACAAALVHTTTLPHSTSVAGLHWVQAKPAKSAIFGVLFASHDPASTTFGLWTNGASPSGEAMKVLWVVQKKAVGRALTVHGIELGSGTDAFFRRFPRAAGGGVGGAIYPSIVDIPHAGCWQLTVATGTFKGTLVVEAFEP